MVDELSLQKGDATANVQMDSFNRLANIKYFDLLNSQGQIYNVDESGMPLNHCIPRLSYKKARERSGSKPLRTKVRLLLWNLPMQVGRLIKLHI